MIKYTDIGGHAGGQKGTRTETGTTAVTGNFYAIQVLEDAVFSLFTDTGEDASGDVMTGFTIDAGTILYGQISAFTLTRGKVRAYKF
jgi:hypothetical protein